MAEYPVSANSYIPLYIHFQTLAFLLFLENAIYYHIRIFVLSVPTSHNVYPPDLQLILSYHLILLSSVMSCHVISSDIILRRSSLTIPS